MACHCPPARQRRRCPRGVSAEVIPGVGADTLPEFHFSPGLAGLLGFRDQRALAAAFRGETGRAGIRYPDLDWTQAGGAHLVAAPPDPFGAGYLVHGVTCSVGFPFRQVRSPPLGHGRDETHRRAFASCARMSEEDLAAERKSVVGLPSLPPRAKLDRSGDDGDPNSFDCRSLDMLRHGVT